MLKSLFCRPQIEIKIFLSAPERHLIKLDFRDHFLLENSTDCKNDYLEVRDGKYGFSSIIKNRLCGSSFPPEIQSKDRYLWLHFHSDDTIEDRGFKAVYEFIQRSPMGEYCEFAFKPNQLPAVFVPYIAYQTLYARKTLQGGTLFSESNFTTQHNRILLAYPSSYPDRQSQQTKQITNFPKAFNFTDATSCYFIEC